MNGNAANQKLRLTQHILYTGCSNVCMTFNLRINTQFIRVTTQPHILANLSQRNCCWGVKNSCDDGTKKNQWHNTKFTLCLQWSQTNIRKMTTVLTYIVLNALTCKVSMRQTTTSDRMNSQNIQSFCQKKNCRIFKLPYHD